MAEEYKDSKTESATPYRREQARKKGKVVRSPEVGNALIILAAVLILMATGPALGEGVLGIYRENLGGLGRDDITIAAATGILVETVATILRPMVPLIIGLAAISAVAGYCQVGFRITPDTLAPNVNKLNPISGMQKFISPRSFFTLGSSSLKVCGFLAVGYVTIRSHLPRIVGMTGDTPPHMLQTMSRATVDLALRGALVMVVIAAIDYVVQRWQYEREMRMTKREVKEERKLLEGNPEVEARVRRVQRMLSRQRMLGEVKNADVIVRNPTHYAVAIKYDAARSAAPVVLAKGANLLAQRILELARKHRIPSVHDAPLARTLYKTVEVGGQIPPKLYRAVARILVHIYRLRGGKGMGVR